MLRTPSPRLHVLPPPPGPCGLDPGEEHRVLPWGQEEGLRGPAGEASSTGVPSCSQPPQSWAQGSAPLAREPFL